ncbi:interactor of constitutive active ROPs 4-like [Prunus avium]|uniref:Interactor of constitutive active ROPs 4-like n=1 Tax=Prunus avium TaxID=42229 RepID=A0A6P5TX77_PRUAV|nr:interactor of constitutive active ROPs 4-like [Prunus avium]XP_021832350.1 interactor of constitutive active ROPs 4-like [Prunus avium]XP_021832358.1 interactor of constitutive active ROPs 4-like [Prunus avium]XP_021832368.1 interactor of constitutive active ROPs 4-like [Prunus avium]
MPRSRGSEMVQRPSPRGAHQLRTSSSDSDPLHHRPITDRSPKLGDRRSPRGTQSDPLNQKKLGTRLADLESQLGQAQDELRILKEQLASAEAAKKEAQEKLEKKTKKPVVTLEPVKIHETHPSLEIQDSNKTDSCISEEVPDDCQRETDVFEVPVENVTVEPKVEPSETDEVEEETKPVDISAEPPSVMEPEKLSLHDLALKNDEINMLRAELEEKAKELEVFGQENEGLKNQLNEAALNFSSAQAKDKEMTLKLSQLEEELEASKTSAGQLNEKLQAMEGEKEAMDAEMKKMRVQTEQWRKAADAAAAVLSGGMEMNGRISERCGSMDKHFGGVFEPPAGGYAGFVGSPADDLDDGFGSGKRKGSGIKMFGDLWKKKGQR